MLGMHVNSQIYGWASFYIKGKEIVDVRYINFCLKVPIRSHHSCNFLSENYRVSNNRLSLTFGQEMAKRQKVRLYLVTKIVNVLLLFQKVSNIGSKCYN